MKTKTLILGIVVAAIGIFTVSGVHAQDNTLPAVKVISTDQDNVVKVIYGYDSRIPVAIKFFGNDGVFFQDKVKGENLEKGFSKKYKLPTTPDSEIWVEVSSHELSVIYKMDVAKNGKWTPQLEKITFNYPMVALN